MTPQLMSEASLQGHFRSSSWAIYLHLMKILECAHLSQTLLWNRGGGEAESAAATLLPPPHVSLPGSQKGPAAGSWNNTRPTRPRAARSDFCSSAGFSEAPGAASLPVTSHVTEHQSKAGDAAALAPAQADLQTLAGNTITQPPRPSSPLRLRERAEAGCWCRWSGH